MTSFVPRTEACPCLTLGDTSLTRIVESEEPLLSPFELYPDYSPSHLAVINEIMPATGYDATRQLLTITIQSFLIRSGGKNILLDACSGNRKQRTRPFFNQRDWEWLDRLAAVGVRPADIDIVLCSHLHVDHVGWNTRLENGAWVPTFPNARYLISQREWDYWRSAPGVASLARTGDFISDSVLPVLQSGQAELIGDRRGLSDVVAIEPAHGHTPGHFVVRVSGGGREAVLSGDLMHSVLQLRYPDWSTRFCVDPDAARTTRKKFLAEHCDRDVVILPSHFPSPTAGFVRRDRGHYHFDFITP